MEPWGIIIVAALSLGVVTGSLAVVYRRMLPASIWARSAGLSVAIAAVGGLVWLLLASLAGGVLGGLTLPVTGLAGLAAFIATVAVRAAGAGAASTLVFAGAWSALVFVPTALLTFGVLAPIGLSLVDHGGSLAVNVATGAAVLGVLLAAGPRAPRLRPTVLPLITGIVAVATLVLAWIAWLVGAELAVDSITPVIVVNGACGAFGGAVGWIIEQRIRHQSTSLSAVAAGLVAGLVAVTAGAPLVDWPGALVGGIAAGAAASAFTFERISTTRRQQWFVVGSHLIAGAVGLVVLGLIARGTGFLFTGSISFLATQALATLVVAVYSTGVAFALTRALRLQPSAVPLPDAVVARR